jgi:hypothetical protein
MKSIPQFLVAGLLLVVMAAPVRAEKRLCLDGSVSVRNQAGWEEKSNYSTSCSFGRFSSADYAVFNGNIDKASSSQPSVQAMVQSIISQIQGGEGIKSFQVLAEGAYPGNPLVDYHAVIKYSKEYRVAHDIRISYYKMIVYSFGSGSTVYSARAYVQNENGSKIDGLFNTEQPKFYDFINSIRLVLKLRQPIKIDTLPRIQRVLPPQ